MNYHDDPDDVAYQTAMELQMRKIPEEQIQKFEGYAAEIFSAFGMDVNTPATKDTPRRFIKALFDATEGLTVVPAQLPSAIEIMHASVITTERNFQECT